MQMRALEVVLKTGKKSKATIGAMRGAWRVAVVIFVIRAAVVSAW